MKTLTRIIAVVMIITVIATLMAACGKTYVDERLIGTWKQTDNVDGNWTWTFEQDGKCKLESDTNNFNSEGTYKFEGEGSGKLYITLKEWGEEKIFTYTCTGTVLQMLGFDEEYYCTKQ